MYAVFVYLEKSFDRVDWKKLMVILKKIGVDWKERRLLSNLYMKQRMKVIIGEEMSSFAYTLQHLLGRFNEELFPKHAGV